MFALVSPAEADSATYYGYSGTWYITTTTSVDADADADADTDTDADTDADTDGTDTGDTGGDKGGCGCASGTPSAAWLAVPALLALRRRR